MPSLENEYISGLQRAYESGEFVVTAEIGPPMSSNASHVEKSADALRGVVHAANVTDNQTSIVRMSSLAASYIGLTRGVETILQMTCRDRNRIAIQSDLLGAYALGLRNLLCLSGDHQSLGNHPQSKNVFDLDSIQLIKAVADMKNHSIFINGKRARICLSSLSEQLLTPLPIPGAPDHPTKEKSNWSPVRPDTGDIRCR